MTYAYSTPTMEKRSPPDLTKFAPLTLTVWTAAAKDERSEAAARAVPVTDV